MARRDSVANLGQSLNQALAMLTQAYLAKQDRGKFDQAMTGARQGLIAQQPGALPDIANAMFAGGNISGMPTANFPQGQVEQPDMMAQIMRALQSDPSLARNQSFREALPVASAMVPKYGQENPYQRTVKTWPAGQREVVNEAQTDPLKEQALYLRGQELEIRQRALEDRKIARSSTNERDLRSKMFQYEKLLNDAGYDVTKFSNAPAGTPDERAYFDAMAADRREWVSEAGQTYLWLRDQLGLQRKGGATPPKGAPPKPPVNSGNAQFIWDEASGTMKPIR